MRSPDLQEVLLASGPEKRTRPFRVRGRTRDVTSHGLFAIAMLGVVKCSTPVVRSARERKFCGFLHKASLDKRA